MKKLILLSCLLFTTINLIAQRPGKKEMKDKIILKKQGNINNKNVWKDKI